MSKIEDGAPSVTSFIVESNAKISAKTIIFYTKMNHEIF